MDYNAQLQQRQDRGIYASTTQAATRSFLLSQDMSAYVNLNQETSAEKRYVLDPAFQYSSRYDYTRRTVFVDRAAAVADLTEAPLNTQLANMQEMTDPTELSKDLKKAMAMEKKAQIHEARMYQMRQLRIQMDGSVRISAAEMKEERKLLDEKLTTIKLFLDEATKDKKMPIIDRLDKKIMAAKDMIDAYEECAYLLPVESAERVDLLAKKEEVGNQLKDLRKQLEIEKLKTTNVAQAMREQDTKDRHHTYEVIRSVLPPGFRPDVSLSREDATYHVQDAQTNTDLQLINRGRRYFGGTKPMYGFEQENAAGQQQTWLYKEAVTCCGLQTRDRAELTAAAAKLQEIVCGDTNYVPVHVARDAQGRPIGTFQLQIEKMEVPTVDLFAWQTTPHEPMLANDDDARSGEKAITTQLLREHVLDWVLGNFDTKGENFLQRPDGTLISLDKEAAFSHMDDRRSEHMSKDEVLHKNDTIYNVMFKEFVNRDPSLPPLDLDFNSVEQQVDLLSQMDNDQYLALFKGYLDEKFKPTLVKSTLHDLGAERAAMERKILERKNNLRSEYANFFGSLIKERLRRLEGHPEMQQELLDKYGDQLVDMPRGRTIFLFPAHAAAGAGPEAAAAAGAAAGT